MEQKPKLKPPTQAQLRTFRLGYGLTQGEAASIAMVSKRTWESWESGSHGREIPISKFKSFITLLDGKEEELKNQGIIKENKSIRELVVINSYFECNIQLIDVIAKDNFIEIKDKKDTGTEFNIVSSIAVDVRGKPYVHKTKFHDLGNESSKTKLFKWQSEKI
jgi:transcriptional regulator with XRE-family HTH domain